MMVCRRRWFCASVILLSSLLASNALAALPPGATAAAMDAATGKAATAIRDSVIGAAPTTATDRNNYATQVAGEFRQCLNSPNADARLNSAIMFAQLQTISSDGVLREMLKSQDASVRYWGAKGLTMISSQMILVGAQKVTADLQAAAKVEKVGTVQQELLRAQIAYGDFAGALDALDGLVNQIQDAIPEASTLDAVAIGLNAVAANMGKVDKVRAGTVASRAASFAIQQYRSFDAAAAANGGVPPGYSTSVVNLLNAAGKVMSAAPDAPKNFNINATPAMKIDELELKVITITGAPGGAPGDLTKAMPKVPVPPAIKK